MEFQEIQSTHSKTMYRLLKQWKSVGKKEFLLEDLYVLLNVPEKSRNSNHFNLRVLKPLKQELPTYFQGLKIQPISDKKYSGRGRKPVIGYTFTWQKQESSEWVENKYELKKENRQAEKDSKGGSYVHKFPNGSQRVVRREELPEWIKENYDSEEMASSVEYYEGKASEGDKVAEEAFQGMMEAMKQLKK